MNKEAVQKISILKHSKIVLPSFLLVIAYFFIFYVLFPHPVIPTKVDGAASDNPSKQSKSSPTLIPATTASYTNTTFINSISSTPTAGASSSVSITPHPLGK